MHALLTDVSCCNVCQDDGYIPNTVEKQIFETMVKIRKRDSSIYDSNKHFFADPSDIEKPDQASRDAKKSKASKPMLLKDVIAQQVSWRAATCSRTITIGSAVYNQPCAVSQ